MSLFQWLSRLGPSISLRCSSFSSPRWCHLQSLSSDVVLVSPLYVAKPPQFCFLAPLCDMLYHHMDISIVVTSSFFNWDPVSGTVSIPYSIADRTTTLWTLPLTCGGALLPHMTPDKFLLSFHPSNWFAPLIYIESNIDQWFALWFMLLFRPNRIYSGCLFSFMLPALNLRDANNVV